MSDSIIYAEVAVNTAVNQTFHYHVPEDMLVWPGHLVRVAFGTAMQPGIVVSISLELPPELEGIQTKPIIELLDPVPVMTLEHIALGMWMSEVYLASPGACLWLMLPPGITGKSQRMVHLLDESAAGQSEDELAILDALREESPLSTAALAKRAGVKKINALIRSLKKQETVSVEAVLAQPSVSQKTIRTVQRAVPPEAVVDALNKLKRAPKQSRVFAYIARHESPLDVTDVYEAADASSADLNQLERKGLVILGERIVYRDSLADRDFVPSQRLALTPEQAQVWERIRGVLQRNLSAKQREDKPSPLQDEQGEGNPTSSPSPLQDEQGEGNPTSSPSPLQDEQGEGNPTPKPPPRIQGGSQQRTIPMLPTPNPSPLQWGGESERSDGGEGKKKWLNEGWVHTYTNVKFYKETLKLRARHMRKNPTPAEDALWQQLRGKKVQDIKFRRQHTINFFIADFYAPAAKLVIEVEGGIHEEQREYDEMRQMYFELLGLRVLRISNEDVLRNLDGVMEVIGEIIAEQHNPVGALRAAPPNTLWGGDAAEGENRVNKFLLHGVTGSGKTEIYLHAIAEVLAQGKQAIFLVPEIALTPQTIRRVAQRFPGQVAVVHGSLSAGERFDTWQRARMGEIGVIVGTRSALFTPLPNIGAIILDEEHDHSYKHSPPFNPPYYHARAVAEKIAVVQGATVILGSATPDLETFYRAQRGELDYLHLPSRIMGHRQRVQSQAKQRGVQTAYQPADGDAMTIDLPPVQVVDMREELKAGNRSMFSSALQHALTEVLERGEQAILFLNRRGQATYVFCRDCGYVAGCPRCDTPLTYHREGEALRCHHCGHQQAPPQVCPECGSDRIRYFGAGTQQVESAVREVFPQAKTVRWDADTASKPDLHEKILAQFVSGEADVMIGTQMVAKGLDLPLVTLVGVVSADPGLALPDFRAQERAFQLLTQVSGRAGRGILGGKVIVQTYQPQHMSVVAASTHDYAAFYEAEIAARRELGYPPFRRMARILVQHTHPIEAQRQIEEAAAQLQHRIEQEVLTDTHLIGPAPCFFSRIDRHYRWQILIRSNDPLPALRGIQPRPGWYVDIDPADVL